MPTTIFALTFLAALVVSRIAMKRRPKLVKKVVPYNYLLMGVLFYYLSRTNDRHSLLTLVSSIGFFLAGLFLLHKRNRLPKSEDS